MSFNLDDPLAGILSDGSDDSFFDDDILGKKKTTKKKITTTEKKSALFDFDTVNKEVKLSDLAPKDKNDTSVSVNRPHKTAAVIEKNMPGSQQVISSPSFKYSASNDSKINEFAIPKQLSLNEITDSKKSPFKSKAGTNNDKIDILDELIASKKDHVESTDKGKGSQSLLDDILGKPSTKASQKTKSGPAKNQQYSFDTILEKNDPKEILTSKKQSKQPIIGHTNEPAQQKKEKTKSSEDWLGIFQEQNEETGDNNPEMPAWLGGSNSLKRKTLERDAKSKVQKEIEKETMSSKPLSEKQVDMETKEITEHHTDLKSTENIDKIMDVVPNAVEVEKYEQDVTMQGATLYLKQQEAQLMLALQLKAQDEKLAAMQFKQKEAQRVQREAANAQHAQLDAMLEKQANHRIQMQAIINAHQDRIAQRIKALLGSNATEEEEDNEVGGVENTPNEYKESPGSKEKKQLLQLIQSLQENHDKEIDLMETSYRRQLAFLEISINQTEERMKEEGEKVVNFYTQKINWLEEHHQIYKKWTEENTKSLMERHNVEKEMLRQQHLENVKVLQEHHSALMENIKNAVKQEQILTRDSAGFSTDIHELLADVKDNRLICQQLVEKVSVLADKTQHEAERGLHARETQINDMIQQLKKEREYFEKEKTESKETIHMLEGRLKQMTSMIEEESASLKQKKMEFDFDKATFSKQTEFAKNILKKQDEEVKMLKEDIQKEYNEKITKLKEENAKALKDSAVVAKEKASIQNLKMELEKTKAELQAQLEEMTEERSKINLEKQELHMEEQRLFAKSKDVEILTKTALEKQSLAEKKYLEAETQQKKYEERIRRIQEHVVSLNTREKQIAKEKIALSRERISLHNDWKQMEGRQQCSLCRSIPKTSRYDLEATYPRSYDVPASRDYGEVNMSHALSAIEQDMAHLMGRTFGLKHDASITDAHAQDIRASYVEGGGHLENVSIESGAYKDYMDPKFMMLRLDVQKVIHNLEDKESTLNKK